MSQTSISFRRLISRKPDQRRGQTLVEYALILAFISVVAIAVLIGLGTRVKGTFTTINSQLSSASTGGTTAPGGGGGGGGGSGHPGQ